MLEETTILNALRAAEQNAEQARLDKAMRVKLTHELSSAIRNRADAAHIEGVGFDPTDRKFTLLWLSFTSKQSVFAHMAHEINTALDDEPAVKVLELSTLTNPVDAVITRYRVKLVINLDKYL